MRRCAECGHELIAANTTDRCPDCRDRALRTAALQQLIAERQAERDEIREEYRR